MSKNWLLDKKKQKKQETEKTREKNQPSLHENYKLFVPPDEENFDEHGIKNLVIKY